MRLQRQEKLQDEGRNMCTDRGLIYSRGPSLVDHTIVPGIEIVGDVVWGKPASATAHLPRFLPSQ